MKIFKLTISIIGIGFIIWFQSCKQNEDPSTQEILTNKISTSWTVGNNGSVMLDDNDVTSYFSDFNLTIFSDNTFTTTGNISPSPWPLNGTWNYVKSSDGVVDLNKLVRDDGLIMTIELQNDSSLIISFMHDEAIHNTSRIQAITGEYVFNLLKK
ncbi:hypothetical protein [Fulvivirga lutimaris]|uniref:hypothetical protein n=1 Tax=Fulvivirga lutimaris TaxID=1819566 RepID=UPI0012BC5943|nr:hypothetical protein [Fulvivirga lutimaris]MTI40896.1 hypothetical protein [Fulvivirga lutimaris]